MDVLFPTCRMRLSAQDEAFIVRALTSPGTQSDRLRELLADPASRDCILDDEMLFHQLIEQPSCLQVSLHLYFYVLVRRSLRDAGFDQRELADYIASLLCHWAGSQAFFRELHTGRRSSYEYVSDLWSMMASADGQARFKIQVYMGNHYLFMTGVFPDHLRHFSEQRGGPNIRFYEQAGRQGFELAAEHRLAVRSELGGIYRMLGENFHEIRQALNDLADRVCFIGA
ncbi:MAG: hypothetical protein ACI9TH_002390 [Kiritimatiellia bacterium]|jgi:hypothetical protein